MTLFFTLGCEVGPKGDIMNIHSNFYLYLKYPLLFLLLSLYAMAVFNSMLVFFNSHSNFDICITLTLITNAS